MRNELHDALAEAAARSGGPGAVAYVGTPSATLFHEAVGRRQIEPEPQPAALDTPYDIASLTKVIATATAVMRLRNAGALELDQPIEDLLPEAGFRGVTIRHLLTHTSGLHAGLPYYKDLNTLDAMFERYAVRGSDWTPGTRRRYSDVGFMLLGRIVERVCGQPLDAYCAKHIFGPLGMTRTAFNPPAAWAGNCAATEACPWRRCVVCGRVHDENAYAVGGVAGHAGLFSTAPDLAKFCRGLLEGRVLKTETLAEMIRLGQTPVYPWQGLGWKMNPWRCGAEGYLPSRHAFGHTGWTGVSLWIDHASGLFAILLGNTCHPIRAARDNETFRRVFHDAVARAFYPRQANVHTGLDWLFWKGCRPIRGQRVGLLTNRAAVDELGRPILDVLRLSGEVRVTRIFTPEHGFAADVEAGEQVGDATLAKIPVTSLYGKRKAPTATELRGIDVLVADLQDVGARYYTYMATLLDCMKACAQSRTPVVVLDRPNPLGGLTEGPVARDTGSLVCCAPIPARHGLTLGELALFFHEHVMNKTKQLDVTVCPIDQWNRGRLFRECALPWTPPSPNIPTPETALLYAGMCLFEGTNLNEGRGTDRPFHRVGAPWLDPEAVMRRIPPRERPGCALRAITYTPQSIPGKASNPRYTDQACRGVEVLVHDPRAARPFMLAVALIAAIRAHHPQQFAWRAYFDVLAGSEDLRKAIETGASAWTLCRRFQPALDTFRETAPNLYGAARENA